MTLRAVEGVGGDVVVVEALEAALGHVGVGTVGQVPTGEGDQLDAVEVREVLGPVALDVLECDLHHLIGVHVGLDDVVRSFRRVPLTDDLLVEGQIGGRAPGGDQHTGEQDGAEAPHLPTVPSRGRCRTSPGRGELGCGPLPLAVIGAQRLAA